MEVDGAEGEVSGPEQHAAIRGGVFWLDPPSSHSQGSELQQQQRQQKPSTEQQQRGRSKAEGADAEGGQKADSSAAVAQALDGAKQAEGSFMYGGGGGSVLLFDAGSPCPRAAWLLPRYAPILASALQTPGTLCRTVFKRWDPWPMRLPLCDVHQPAAPEECLFQAALSETQKVHSSLSLPVLNAGVQ